MENTTTDSKSKDYQIIRRSGDVVAFEQNKINVAMTKAFLEVRGTADAASVRDTVAQLTADVVRALVRSRPEGGTFHIEDVQDAVELSMMRAGHQDVARAYVLYRERHKQAREQERQAQAAKEDSTPTLHALVNGERVVLDLKALQRTIALACQGLNAAVTPDPIFSETLRNLYDGVPIDEVHKATILAARTLIEIEPDYTYATARLLLNTIVKEVFGQEVAQPDMGAAYAAHFPSLIQKGVANDRMSPDLLSFDLDRLGRAMKPERDLQFNYLGLQTLYDRYFIHVKKTRIELPQSFFMRVAMGLALSESDKNARAIEFYDVLSSFDFMSSTPTLFNAGSLRMQLSSCFLTTVPDDLAGIYDAIKENALLSKFAGGLGNDWTPVRALGSYIQGTNGESQGTVPFLKVANDTAVAVNQGGKRQGAVCAYLETWHMDIEEFVELRKNTGDDRRRTHDMNTSNWIPDLFMRRVMEKGTWTLFSPSDVPDLHDLYGKAFEEAYINYEAKALNGEIKKYKQLPAVELWRKMLSMLFETGHPWFTFKDPCNIRSPQRHAGVVHSSNLCTEITLNTSDEETAVCNLGSVNLVNHMVGGKLDLEKLRRTVTTAMRMLDNVIDINYYAVEKARNSNLRHRPVGLGVMGFQDCLYIQHIPYASQEAVEFADESMEAICYFAYSASSDLAVERGSYGSYEGSLWSQGILPPDSVELLAQERGLEYVQVVRGGQLNWNVLREKILKQGMRNSNCVAIAPTATISNIIGVEACIEPCFGNLSVKSNLSGEFTVINKYLVQELKDLGVWDKVMVMDLKHFDGSLEHIDRIPQRVKELYATAFEVDPNWIIEAASRRQKWIDQAQSLNIYMAGASGKKLDETYKFAWTKGLKTTYYLRTRSATSAEKSTVAPGRLNAVSTEHQPTAIDDVAAKARAQVAAQLEAPTSGLAATDIRVCGIDDPTCESCQ